MIFMESISNLCTLTTTTRLKEISNIAKLQLPPINPNTHAPKFALFMPDNAGYSNPVTLIKLSVLLILSQGYMAKISPSVITTNPVDMVNLIWRPISGHVNKGKTVSEVLLGVNFYLDVTGAWHMEKFASGFIDVVRIAAF